VGCNRRGLRKWLSGDEGGWTGEEEGGIDGRDVTLTILIHDELRTRGTEKKNDGRRVEDGERRETTMK
jgi:hypothetical protein